MRPPLFLALICCWTVMLCSGASLSGDQIDIVIQRLAQGAQQSWELGTRAQALLEYDSANYSVLTVGAVVPPPSNGPPSTLSDVFSISSSVVRNLMNGTTLPAIPTALIPNDGAAADPASIGVAVLLANWTRQQASDGLQYAQAATDQFNYLMLNVSRTGDGAISHRVSEVQLWSDFVYMVPPFLAYYGVLTGNRSAISEAYNQIKLYRSYLRDSSAGGLWKHIVLGNGTDSGHWSTGNGWAAAGMLRVLGTIKNSRYANSFKTEQTNLANWVLEIQDAMYAHLRSSNLFGNYVDVSTSFDDAASTALLASTVYRLSLITNIIHKHLPAAEQTRNALSASSLPSGSAVNTSSMNNLTHFDVNGWLTPVANPYDFSFQGSHSPEGQAFVVMMQAAWSDWVAAGSQGANEGARLRVPAPTLLWGVLGAIVLVMFTA